MDRIAYYIKYKDCIDGIIPFDESGSGKIRSDSDFIDVAFPVPFFSIAENISNVDCENTALVIGRLICSSFPMKEKIFLSVSDFVFFLSESSDYQEPQVVYDNVFELEPYHEFMGKSELKYLKLYMWYLLKHTECNISKAAQIAGVARRTMYRLMEQCGIPAGVKVQWLVENKIKFV